MASGALRQTVDGAVRRSNHAEVAALKAEEEEEEKFAGNLGGC